MTDHCVHCDHCDPRSSVKFVLHCTVTPPLLCIFPSDDGAGSDKIPDYCVHRYYTVHNKTALNAATLQKTGQILGLVEHCKALYRCCALYNTIKHCTDVAPCKALYSTVQMLRLVQHRKALYSAMD